MKWHHAGIQVRNLADSIEFYEDGFDFKFEQFLSMHDEKIAFLKKDYVRLELVESGENPLSSSSIHISWQVDNIENWIQKLEERGLHPIEGPYRLENGWVLVFYEGKNQEVIELIQVD